MGFLEKILVTPAHHRVHHAINKEYLDKNLSQIFIFWDNLFGTFQEERDDIPPVYGVTIPVNTWNPFKINFIHLWQLLKDAWRTKYLKDKIRVFFMPPGWRPEDVAQKYPIKKEENVYKIPKYSTTHSFFDKIFITLQILFVLLLTVLLYYYIAHFSLTGMVSLGAFIFLCIYSYSEFMDDHRNALIFELIKGCIGIGFLFLTDLWNPISTDNFNIKLMISAYLIISFFLTFWLITKSKRNQFAV